MLESYPFPMYSGILEPKHYKRIGTAIWLFLWCISSTTKETVDEKGETLGHVLGNKPMKLSEIAVPFGVNEKTVSRWIDSLEECGYIQVIRAPYGLILSVRNSKKGLDKNVRSEHERTDKNVLSVGREQTKMSDLLDKNVRSNKDIKITTTTITETFNEIFGAFCKIHGKLDIHVKPTDVTTMQEIVNMGVPASTVINVMEQIYQERGSRIHSFGYYKDAILDAWQSQIIMSETAVTTSPTTPDAVSGTVAPGWVALSSRPWTGRTKLEQRNEELLQMIRDAEEKEGKSRGQKRTVEAVYDYPERLSGV